jgi:hypothetical protein
LAEVDLTAPVRTNGEVVLSAEEKRAVSRAIAHGALPPADVRRQWRGVRTAAVWLDFTLTDVNSVDLPSGSSAARLWVSDSLDTLRAHLSCQLPRQPQSAALPARMQKLWTDGLAPRPSAAAAAAVPDKV